METNPIGERKTDDDENVTRKTFNKIEETKPTKEK